MDQVQPVERRSNRLVSWVGGIRGFLVATVDEMKKVTWPTREELIRATRAVVLLTLAIGIAIGILDRLLQLILVDGVAALAR
jgi:preprotein translocase SecE subunit